MAIDTKRKLEILKDFKVYCRNYKKRKINMERLSNLERIRKTKGLTREELAKLSEINPTTIQRLEKGMYNVDMVKLGTLIALSKALHCKVVDLIDKDLQRFIR